MLHCLDFQLFSNSGKTASETFSEEMQDDGKARLVVTPSGEVT
jgi:hypothetical protein